MSSVDLESRLNRNRGLVERMPDNHLARFGLANALMEGSLWEEAAGHFRKCLASQPEWMAVAISLGRCLVELRQGTEAREMLAAARRMAVAQGHTSPLEEIAALEARIT